jgi:hypothetical protein
MKYLPVIFICLLWISACRKNDSAFHQNNGRRLTSIVRDSGGTFDFAYSNNLITSVRHSFPEQDAISTYSGSTSIVQYSNTDSNQLVSLGFFTNSSEYSISYILNSAKLPLRIFSAYTENRVVHQIYLARFFYFPNTDKLDSVILNSANNSEWIIYKFNYAGQNITRITEWQISSTQNLQVAAFDFTYDPTPNIFRQTDPLLYIYSYPFTAFASQPMVIATFFAETFSRSTFNSVTTSGITSGAWQQNSLSSKMTFHLNSNGKVTAETFSNSIFEDLAGKKYLYE